MAVCPKCKEEINFLHYYGEVRHEFDGKRYIVIGEVELAGSFECPDCTVELFTSEEEARTFLLGK